LTAGFLVSGLFVSIPQAFAATTYYQFSFTGTSSSVGSYSGQGIFDVEAGVITNITHSDFSLNSVDQGAMTLLPLGPTSGGLPGFGGNDNTFLDTAPYFSILGFSFTAGSAVTGYAGTPYNIFSYTTSEGWGSQVSGDCTSDGNCIADNITGNPSTSVNFTVVPLSDLTSITDTTVGTLGVSTITGITSGTTVAELVTALASTDGSTQTYAVMNGTTPETGTYALQINDTLVVTAADGVTTGTYTLTVSTPASLTLTVPQSATIMQSTSLVTETNGTASDMAVSAAITGVTPIAVNLANTGDAASVDNVRIAPINAGPNVQLWAEDSTGWYDIAVTGWGPSTGFSVLAGYNATTSVYAISDATGTYPLVINLVDAANSSTVVASGHGTLTVTAPVYPVVDVNTGIGYATIQAAVDAASSSDVIDVAAGTYAGSVTISKGLTINGPNAGINPNTTTTPRVAEAIINTGNPAITINTVDPVTISGFTFDGTGSPISSGMGGTAPTITDNIIKNTLGSDNSDLFFQDATTLTLKDNQLSNLSPAANDGTRIIGSDDGSIGTNVTIAGNVWENSPTQTGINATNVKGTVSGNTFENIADYGLLISNNSTLTVSGNTFKNVTSTDPTVSTWGAGIRFYTPMLTQPVTITGNTFTNDVLGIAVRPNDDGSAADLSKVAINGNLFVGDTVAGVYNAPNDSQLDAIGNWWGDASGPLDTVSNDSSTPDTNASGTGSPAIGAIDYSNWCVTADCVVAPTTYTLTYTAGTGGTITGTSPQTVNSGANGSAVTAVPATGYTFTGWSDGSTANPRTDSDVIADVSVTANFTAIPVVVSSGGSSGGGGGGGYYSPYTTTNNGGQVLGASTTGGGNVGQVLGASTTNFVALEQQLQNLEQQLITLEFKTNSCSLTFNTNLSKGMTSSEVQNLQKVLNYTSLTQVAATGPGSPNNETTYFGSATQNAVIAFQNIFANQILTPNGLTSGNGYVGASTRSVLNGLCSQVGLSQQ
jgi:uncharacterized repeat protein (TIGR02543 family)